MRRADVLLTVLALGCTRTAPSLSPPLDARAAEPSPDAPKAATVPGPDAAGAPSDPVFIHVTVFDCMKHNVFPGEAPPTGPIPANASIRSWNGGGPNGANWNVQDLRCFVRAVTPCTRGKVILTLRVGHYTVAERVVAPSKGSADFELIVPEAAWERGYDSSPKAAPLKLPFKTAAFRAQVALVCEAPTKVQPADWRFTSAAAEDVFVAGFASGE